MLPEPLQSRSGDRQEIIATDEAMALRRSQKASQSTPDDDPETVEPDPSQLSIAARSEPSSDDALRDDDRQWIEAIVADHAHRSVAARRALAMALLDDHEAVTGAGHVSGLELDQRESEGKSSPPRTPPVSGTSLQKTAVFQALVTPSRAKCRTEVSHTAQGTFELTLGNRWARDDLHRRTEDERCFASLLLISSSETGRGRDIGPSRFR